MEHISNVSIAEIQSTGLIGNPMIFRQLPLEDALARTIDAGIDDLELWPPQISQCRTPGLCHELANYVRTLGANLVRLNCADRDYFQSITSADQVPTVLEGLKGDIDMAANLEMSQVLTWEGRRAQDISEEQIDGPILNATAELFRQACVYASAKNMSLTVEVHPYTLGIDVDWLIQLYDKINAENFNVTYDCCHYGIGLPDGYIDVIGKLGERIQHVHFCDSDQISSELHFPPGTGCLDLNGIIEALKLINFSGTVMMDLWLYPFPEYGARIGVPYVRDVMCQLGLV